MKLSAVTAVLAVLLTLAVATGPAAASPSQKQYGNPAAAAIRGATQQHKQTPSPVVSSGSLPFTGLELTVPLVIALALVGLGFAVRRSTQKRGS